MVQNISLLKLRKLNKKSGFTLIEIVVTILVIALLVILLISALNMQAQKANEAGVEVDMRSFYVAAKSTILSDQEGKLSTKELFIKELNGFLDPAMQINSSNVYSNQNDPWKQPYEIRWRSREDASGRTEYWVAFISKGVKLRDGWIFEPDKPNNPQYSRSIVDAETYPVIKVYRYITVLGYYSGGIVIPQMPDPSIDVPWILGVDPPENKDFWAYLTFDIEEDDIEFDPDKLTKEGDILELPNGSSGSSDSWGLSGSWTNWPDGGKRHIVVHDVKGQKGHYAWINLHHSPITDPAGWAISNAPLGLVNHVQEETISNVGGDIDTWFKSQGKTIESTVDPKPNPDDSEYTVTINLGKGNKIVIKFKGKDKLAEAMWYRVGATITVEAVPGEDYDFKYWKINGIKTDDPNPLTLTVTADTNFTAKFSAALDISTGKLKTKSGKLLSEVLAEDAANKASIKDSIADKIWEASYNERDDAMVLKSYKGHTGSGVDLVIPSTMSGKSVQIGSSYFSSSNPSNPLLEGKTFGKVVIPNNCKLYGSNIFRDCTIDTLIVGDGVSTPAFSWNGAGGTGSSNVTTYAFKNCTFNNVVIGENVSMNTTGCTAKNITTSTAGYVLSGCTSYTQTNKVTTLPTSFNNAKDTLETIRIQGNIPEVSAFTSCTKLKSITFEKPITSIATKAFYNLTSLETFKADTSALTTVGTSAFANCRSLDIGSIDLSNCSTIRDYAFYGIKSASNINLPSIQTIRNQAFANIVGEIGDVSIGDSCTEISSQAFANTKLGNIVVPGGCKISTNAFKGSTVKTLEISSGSGVILSLGSLKADKIIIGSGRRAPSLDTGTVVNELIIDSNVTLPRGNQSATSRGISIKKLVCKSSIRESYALANLGLEEVRLEGEATTVGAWIFANNGDTLKSLYIGENVTSIDTNNFAGKYSFPNLTNIVINNSEDKIPKSWFTKTAAYTNGSITYLKDTGAGE